MKLQVGLRLQMSLNEVRLGFKVQMSQEFRKSCF